MLFRSIQGPWLMDQMQEQARALGTNFVSDTIAKVDLSRRPFSMLGDSGDVYTCDTLIIATGASANWLGMPSESKFQGFGVSACATCDGFFFRGKKVVVVGGGNSAVEEALYLSNIAAHVTVVHRRDSFRAEKILQDRLLQRANVKVKWNCAVEEVLGGGEPLGVTGVKVHNGKTGAYEEILADGGFVAIGHAPATELVREQLTLKPNGYVQTAPGSTATSVEGVYAAGDVADDVFRQAVTAAGLGCMAALEAERWLAAMPLARQAAE